jgi:hypothetical protein
MAGSKTQSPTSLIKSLFFVALAFLFSAIMEPVLSERVQVGLWEPESMAAFQRITIRQIAEVELPERTLHESSR